MIRLILTLALLLALPAQATINAASFQRTVLVSPDGKRHSSHPAGDYDPSPPERVVRYAGTFEGAFGGNTTNKTPDGGFVKALSAAGADACTGSATTLANYIANSGYLVRVEDQETINGSTISPRSGGGFMYQALDSTLSYAGCPSGGVNSPRVSLSLTQAQFKATLPYDTTILQGFSFFIPQETEAENCGTNNLDYRMMWIQEGLNEQGRASSGNWAIGYATKTDGDIHPQFLAKIHVDPSKYYALEGEGYYVWLGDVENDRGYWVDFVIRFRVNPYAADGRGIFQVWRTNPSNRSGPLKLVYNLATDTAYPVGGGTVTNAAWLANNSSSHMPADLRDQFGMAYALGNVGMEIDYRLYKFAWAPEKNCKPYPNGSTITSRFLGFGFDDIYIAHESDGADCTDVTPDRAACEAIP